MRFVWTVVLFLFFFLTFDAESFLTSPQSVFYPFSFSGARVSAFPLSKADQGVSCLKNDGSCFYANASSSSSDLSRSGTDNVQYRSTIEISPQGTINNVLGNGPDNTGGTDMGDDIGGDASPIGCNVPSFLTLTQGNSFAYRAFMDGIHAVSQANQGCPSFSVQQSEENGPIVDQIEEALTNNPNFLGVVGLMNDNILKEVMNENSNGQSSLMAMGPIVENPASVDLNMNKYFIRPSPTAELYAMVEHLLGELRVKRIGIMALNGCPLSEAYLHTLTVALRSGHDMVPTVFAQSVTDTNLDKKSFATFLKSDPQVVFIIASPHPITTAFAEEFSTNPQAVGIPLLVTNSLFELAVNISTSFTDFSFYFTSTNLFSSDTDSSYIRDFNEAMTRFYGSQNGQAFENMSQMSQSLYNQYTVYGWLLGQVLTQSVTNENVAYQESSYQMSLYTNTTYTIDDATAYGPFYGVVTYGNNANEPGYEWVPDKCNQGGHMVHVYLLSTDFPSPSLRGSYEFSGTGCGMANYTVPFFQDNVILAYQNSNILFDVALEMRQGLSFGSMYSMPSCTASNSSSAVVQNVHVVRMRSDSTVMDYCETHMVDVIVGPLVDASSVSEKLLDVLIVDPVDTHTIPRLTNPMVIYLMPTLEQQIYIAAQVSKMMGYTFTVLLQKNEVFDRIKGIIQNIIAFVGVQVQSFKIGSLENGAIPAEYLSAQYTLLIDLIPSNLLVVRQYLERYPDRYFSVLYEDFSLYYSEIQQVFDGASHDVKARFVTQTNLPVWTDFKKETLATHPGLEDYHNHFSANETSPATLQGWYTAGIVKQLLSAKVNHVVSTVKESIYRKPLYKYGGIIFSLTGDDSSRFKYVASSSSSSSSSSASSSASLSKPWTSVFSSFSSATSTTQKSSPTTDINYAAININVISLRHVEDPEYPISFGPFTPNIAEALDVRSRKGRVNVNVLLSGMIPFSIAICVALGLLLYLWCCRNTSPPTNPHKPVTLLICDIYSSGGLWALHPREMVKATNQYQVIVRKLIREFRCYEVKLMGDAFLIASNDPARIVNLSAAIQRELFEFQWGTPVFDLYYLQNECNMLLKMLNIGNENNKEDKMGKDHPNEDEQVEDDINPECGEGDNIKKEKTRIDSADDVVSPTFPLEDVLPLNETELQKLIDTESYCHQWNGLRVRMGIHTGLCQLVLGEHKTTVDYRGDTVYTTARTEQCAHGGQILMTQSTWEHLRDSDLLSSLYADIAVSDAGARSLRGVPLPVQMYEVEAVEYREWNVTSDLVRAVQRQHNIRESDQDIHMKLPEEDDNDDLIHQFLLTPSSVAASSNSMLLNTQAESVYHVMMGLFSSFSPKERLSHLSPLLQQWHVPTQVPTNMDEDARFDTLVQRLCNRTAGAVQNQQKRQPRSILKCSSMVSCFSKSSLCHYDDKPNREYWEFSGGKRFASAGGAKVANLGFSPNRNVTAFEMFPREPSVSHGALSLLAESDLSRCASRNWAMNPFAKDSTANATSELELLQTSNISGFSGAEARFFYENAANEEASQYGVSFGGVGGSEGVSFVSGGTEDASRYGFGAAVSGEDVLGRDRSLSSFRRRSQFTGGKNTAALFRPRITSFMVQPDGEDSSVSTNLRSAALSSGVHKGPNPSDEMNQWMDLHSPSSISQSRKPVPNETSSPSLSMVPRVTSMDPELPPPVTQTVLVKFPASLVKHGCDGDGAQDRRFVVRRPTPKEVPPEPPLLDKVTGARRHSSSALERVTAKSKNGQEDILSLHLISPPHPVDAVQPWPKSQQLRPPELPPDHTMQCQGPDEEFDCYVVANDDSMATSLTRREQPQLCGGRGGSARKLGSQPSSGELTAIRACVQMTVPMTQSKEKISSDNSRNSGRGGQNAVEEDSFPCPVEQSMGMTGSDVLVTRGTACFRSPGGAPSGEECGEAGSGCGMLIDAASIPSSVVESNLIDGENSPTASRYRNMSVSFNNEGSSQSTDFSSTQNSDTAFLK